MTLPDSIYAYLKTRDALTDIVDDNIFHVDTERQSPPKAVYFEAVGEDQLRAFILSPVLSSVRMSFECWAATTAGGQAVSEAIAAEVYAAFCNPDADGAGNFRGTMADGVYVQDIRFESSRPLYDEATRKFGRELDFTFDYRL